MRVHSDCAEIKEVNLSGWGAIFCLHLVYEILLILGQKLDTETDSLLSLTSKCHDGHQELLLQEEEKLHNSVHEWASEYLSSFR